MKVKKKCKIEGCDFPVFGHDYCLMHYKIHYLLPKEIKNRNKKKLKSINRFSKKQVKRLNIYESKKIEKKWQLVEQGKWCCLFTGKRFPLIGPMPGFHHLLGRDGDHMTDIDLIWPVYNEPHRQYHDLDYERIIKLPWYEDFLTRLKNINEQCHHLETKKKEKALQRKI